MTLIEHQMTIRIAAFVVVFAGMIAWELIRPLRAAAANRLRRDLNNLGLLLVDVLLLRLLFPGALVGAAAYAGGSGIGLANAMSLPVWLSAPAAVIVLDAAIYGQHVLFHAVTPLWRLHRVHHTDTDLDVTTAVRFHPAEILLSFLFKTVIVLALGVPVAGVIVFEILLNGMAMFNHANVGLSAAVDNRLRRVLVTPRMHWVHHSVVPLESRHNFGFCLSWWDRLFGTYQSTPGAGYAAMQLGVTGFSGAWATRLLELLWQPVHGDESENAEVYEIRRTRRRSK